VPPMSVLARFGRSRGTRAGDRRIAGDVLPLTSRGWASRRRRRAAAGPPEESVEIVAGDSVAFARGGLQALAVEDSHLAAAVRDGARALERLGGDGHGRAPDAEQPGELVVGECKLAGADAVVRHQEPARAALLERVEAVARHRLRDLVEEVLRVAEEHVTERPALAREGLEVARDDAPGQAGDLDDASGDARRARQTVSEVASAFQAAGLIDYRLGRVTVEDRAGLERAACECYRAVRAHFERLLGAPRG
jgi:hypothetical protein